MPFIERIAIQEATTIPNDSGVVQIKLPSQGALYNLEILLGWTNGATHAQDVSIFDAFDLIEIVADGSNYIFSGTPFELYQLNTYQNRKLPYVRDIRGASQPQSVVLNVMFWLNDMDYQHFLPLARWNDIELRLHYSPLIAATDGFATGTGTYSVYADISYDAGMGNGAGYQRYQTIQTYTSVGSGVKQFQIDGSAPLLALLVNNQHATNALVSTYSKVEVLLRDRSRKIFTAVPVNYARQLATKMKIDLDFALTTYVSNTDSTLFIGDDIEAAAINAVLAAPTIGTTLLPHYIMQPLANRSITFTAFNDTADGAATAQVAYTTDQTVYIHGKYRSVPGGMLIPFGFLGNMQNAVVPSNVSRMNLELTDAVASTVTRIGQLELAAVS